MTELRGFWPISRPPLLYIACDSILHLYLPTIQIRLHLLSIPSFLPSFCIPSQFTFNEIPSKCHTNWGLFQGFIAMPFKNYIKKGIKTQGFSLAHLFYSIQFPCKGEWWSVIFVFENKSPEKGLIASFFKKKAKSYHARWWSDEDNVFWCVWGKMARGRALSKIAEGLDKYENCWSFLSGGMLTPQETGMGIKFAYLA